MEQRARAVLVGLSLWGFSSCAPELPKPVGSQRCNPTCEQINFEQDPRILRGAWTAYTEIALASGSKFFYSLFQMNLTARYRNNASYEFSGTATLEGRTFQVSGGGLVYLDQTLLRGQLSPADGVYFELKEGEDVVYRASFYRQQAVSSYQGYFNKVAGKSVAITLERNPPPP